MGRFEQIDTIQPFLKIQEGDWADVYKAYDSSLDKKVLLKRLKSEFEFNPEVAQRFAIEAQLMADLDHPNVVEQLSHSFSVSRGLIQANCFLEAFNSC